MPGVRIEVSEREEISRGLVTGCSYRLIAARLDRPTSTVAREVERNGGRRLYRAIDAHQRAWRCARRPKDAKLGVETRLRIEVENLLRKRWSPQQISNRLRRDHPDDERMWVSTETIYRSLYVQTRGALKRELTSCLRRGHAWRRPRNGRVERRGKIANMVLISQRPAEVADRAVPGHWEGDLLMGASARSAIGTLVERSSRFTMLAALPDGRAPSQVNAALATTIQELPTHLKRSLTWDQGKEMHRHAAFTIDTGVAVYFCDPRSPWQRGTNENTNGLLRQYLPDGTDLRTVTQHDLDLIADELNGRPRRTLNWRTPAEAFADFVATTT